MEGWFENKTAATLSELEFNGTYFAGSSIIHQKLELCVDDEQNARVVCGSLEKIGNCAIWGLRGSTDENAGCLKLFWLVWTV